MTIPHALAQSPDTVRQLAEQAHQITLDINAKRDEIGGQAELVARLKRQHKEELEKLNEMRAAEKNLIEDLIRVQNGQFIERLPFEPPRNPQPGDTLKFIDTITVAELLANEFEPDTIAALVAGGIANGQDLRLWLAKPTGERKKIKGVSAPMVRRLDVYLVNRIAKGSAAEAQPPAEPTPEQAAEAQAARQIVEEGIADVAEKAKRPADDASPAAAAADAADDPPPEIAAVKTARNELADSLDSRLALAGARKDHANRQILLMGVLQTGDKIPQQRDARELAELRERIDKLSRRDVVRIMGDNVKLDPKAKADAKAR